MTWSRSILWTLGLVLGLCGWGAVAQADVGDHYGAVTWGDFDGDGELETVASAPRSDCGKGRIHIRRAGLPALTVHRDVSGVAGVGACYDYFGSALAVGDFDGDGYDDLAVSAPGADDSGVTNGGAVHVFYGSSTGLSFVGDQILHQGTTGIDGVPETYDYMGDSLTTGDFDCDGYDDLVIGVPREGVGSNSDAGAVQVLFGSAGGVSTVDDLWRQGAGGVNGVPESGDQFGAAIAAGNFNGDTSGGRACDDLAVASPREDVGSISNAGFVYIMDGGTAGLSTAGDQAFHQNSAGVDDVAQAEDLFGLRLATRDENGDGRDDLFISVPGDSCEAVGGEGTHVMFGSVSGISTADDELRCNRYRCVMDGASLECGSNSPSIHGAPVAETFSMFVGNDVVHADDGNDVIDGEQGDDVVFGGPGDDDINGDAGVDLLIGGTGNDTFTLRRDCDGVLGEFINGGPGTDTVRSHLSESELIAAGVRFYSIENFVTVPEAYAGGCGPYTFEEGPFVRPPLELTWVHLPDSDDTYLTSNGEVSIDVENTSSLDVDYDLVYHLSIRGYQVMVEDSDLALDSGKSTRRVLDLYRFVPPGVDTQNVPPELLALPTSAQLRVQANIRPRGKADDLARAFTMPVWGHHEAGEARLYREDLYSTTYHHGDLVGWRIGRSVQPRPYRYVATVEARVVKQEQAQ